MIFLVLTVSVYMLQVYDRVLPSRSIETLIYLTLIAGGALAAMAALDVLRSRILVRLGVWIDRMLSPALFGRAVENTLRGLPYRTEALRDLATIRTYLGGAGIMALFDAPWMPIISPSSFSCTRRSGFLPSVVRDWRYDARARQSFLDVGEPEACERRCYQGVSEC